MNINHWSHYNISSWDGHEYSERFSFSMPIRASMIPNNNGQPFINIFNNHFMKCVEFLKKKHADTIHATHLDKISKIELRHVNNPTKDNVWVDMVLVDDSIVSDVVNTVGGLDTLEMLLDTDADTPFNRMSKVTSTFDRYLPNSVVYSIYVLAAKEWVNTEEGYLVDPKDIFIEVS